MKTTFTISDIQNSKVARLNQHLFNQVAVKKKRSKYNAVKVEFDGHVFDSQKECNRYINLRALLQAGTIKDLQLQVAYRLETENVNIASYIADFVYTVVKTGETIVEDVKSPATRRLAVYRLKKKLMHSQYKIEIKEV